jgi:uncharacterized protein (TIGR03435 family)
LWTPDGFKSTNSWLQEVLIIAYDLRDPNLRGGPQFHGIVGAPDWVYSDRYDIEAKISPSDMAKFSELSTGQQIERKKEMLQALLADRFKLKIHRELADIDCYALIPGKNGLRNMKKEPDDETFHVSWSGKFQMAAHAIPFDLFVSQFLSAHVGCPIVDKTGLAGKYDFVLNWAPDSSPVSVSDGASTAPEISGPTIFIALEEQLGLKLEHVKVPMERIVMDHIERPSEN